MLFPWYRDLCWETGKSGEAPRCGCPRGGDPPSGPHPPIPAPLLPDDPTHLHGAVVPKVGAWTTASASPGDLFEINVLRLHPEPAESETPGGLPIGVFTSPPVGEPLSYPLQTPWAWPPHIPSPLSSHAVSGAHPFLVSQETHLLQLSLCPSLPNTCKLLLSASFFLSLFQT